MQHPDVGCVLQVYWLEHPYVQYRMCETGVRYEAILDTKWDVSHKCIMWKVLTYRVGYIMRVYCVTCHCIQSSMYGVGVVHAYKVGCMIQVYCMACHDIQ